MKKSFVIGFCVFATVILLTQYLAFQQYQIARIEESQVLNDQLNLVGDKLRKTLGYGLGATNTLAFIVEEYGVPKDFESLARDIMKYHKYIDILELTKKGVITHVYPLEGNEEALGLDVLAYSKQGVEAFKAIEKKELFFAGPLEMVQGGMAVIGRLPIYRSHQFFGFSVVVIKLSTLIRSIGIREADTSRFRYQLSKINPITNQEEFFLPDTMQKSNKSGMSIEVPDGEWKLYIESKSPSIAGHRSIAFSILGIILSAVLGLYSYQWVRQPEKLQQLLNEKTTAITHEKYLSDSIIKSLPGAFYLYDSDLRFVRWNQNFEEVTGYSGEEIKQMSPLDLFDGKEKEILARKISSVFDHGEDKVEANFVTKTGEKIPYFFTGHKILYEGKEHLIGTGIDITERIMAQQKVLEVYKEKEITLNRISDGVVSLDEHCRYQFINEAALSIFPMGRKGAIGKKILEIQPEIVDTPLWEVSLKAMRTMTVREIENYYEPLEIWFLVKIYPSEDGVTVFFRDISDRKKIEQETLKLIGRELHDNVVQVLTGANMYLNLAKEKDEIPDVHLHETGKLIRKGIDEIRKLSHDLISPFDDGTTLVESLEEIFMIVSKGSTIQIERNFDGFNENFISDKLKLCLYRITQEQFNNIVKYAGAERVKYCLVGREDQLVLSIKDDGVGFEPSTKPVGIGFANIRSRSALFGGEVIIDSSPGNGCMLKVTFPSQSSMIA